MNHRKRSWLYTFVITGMMVVVLFILQGVLSPGIPADQKSQSETFDQIWKTVNENFFDPKFNGVDWNAQRQKYQNRAVQAPSREAFATVINQMLSDLKTSHTRFYTSDEPAYYQVLGIFQRNSDIQRQLKTLFPRGKIEYSGIGIVTKTIHDQIFISGVFDGSPGAQAGLQVGDRILSVAGEPFQPVRSFADKVGKPVKILVQRTAAPDSQREITVTPKLLDATGMFLDAQKASTTVFNRDGKKIGYTHIWSYAGDQYQQQLEEDLIYGPLREADAMVLDLRDGWGGAPITALNIYSNDRDLSITSIPRSGKRYVTYGQWHKPVVMLVNEGSRSAKEILAFGFQQYNIGPVVGTTTAGAVVAGRPFLMRDGSLLYVAVADVYLNGDRRLEGPGVTPDIVVSRPLEYSQAADPQKERAIAVALDTLTRK